MAAARQAPRGLIFPRGTGFPDAREWIPFWTQTIYRQSGNHFAMQSGLVKPGRECAGGRGQRNASSNKSAI
ncbi:hypothetical protein [Burkholderia glumae]